MDNLIIINIHLAAAITAFVLGIWNLLAPKGTPRHRLVGRSWIALMLVVALPSFWIRELGDGSFSWIHGLSVITLLSMLYALWCIRSGRVRGHAMAMIGTMTGLIIAGIFALMPGRTISRMVGYG